MTESKKKTKELKTVYFVNENNVYGTYSSVDGYLPEKATEITKEDYNKKIKELEELSRKDKEK